MVSSMATPNQPTNCLFGGLPAACKTFRSFSSPQQPDSSPPPSQRGTLSKNPQSLLLSNHKQPPPLPKPFFFPLVAAGRRSRVWRQQQSFNMGYSTVGPALRESIHPADGQQKQAGDELLREGGWGVFLLLLSSFEEVERRREEELFSQYQQTTDRPPLKTCLCDRPATTIRHNTAIERREPKQQRERERRRGWLGFN